VASPANSTPASDRHSRRRTRTRTRLLNAARTLFASKGIDAVRINEITELADVGFGSFYNHFGSKEEIVDAVVAEALAGRGAAVELASAAVADPAEAVAVGHRYFVRLARDNADWAWLLIRLDVSHNLAFAALSPYAERDLERGIGAGRFHLPNRRMALLEAGGALLAVMRDVLDGNAPADADSLHAEFVLRLLGLDPDEAAEIARRPMPAVDLP
jgi:AcrR family transcriptional regulator